MIDTTDGQTFHGVRLAWSVCGRATVVDTESREPVQARMCDRCVLLTGPPPAAR